MRLTSHFARVVLAVALVALAGFHALAAGQPTTWPQQLRASEEAC